MPTRLLLEGRDLDELVTQVRAEFGPDAVIVSAEKVRTGGVGGLFGTQKYELTVEVPEPASNTEPPGSRARKGDTPKRGLSIEDLATMADTAEKHAEKSKAEPPPASPPAGPETGPQTSFAEMLADARDPFVAAERAPTGADALNRLLAGGGEQAPEGGTPSVRPFRPAANQPIAKLGVRQVNDPRFEAQQRQRPPQAASPARPPVPDPWQESSMPVETTMDKPRTPDMSDRMPAQERATERTSSEKSERQNGLTRRLQSLGVPSDIAMRAHGGDTYSAVVEAFAALPTPDPAPDGPGETLIVIGESIHPVEVARWVAEAQRLDDDHILFAGRNAIAAGIDSRRRITGAHDARQWAKKLRKSDAPSVVAVEAALDESGWAAAIVDAVRPVAVWVVVDASRKTSDVAHHLQGLRRVDAICLRGTGSSGDPASPLSLRLPVALLDGRPSTPYQWAAMLCERLSLVGN